MSKYDFTSIMERKGHDALAVDALGNMPGFAPDMPGEGFDVIPMWVADMNFPVVPRITQAIEGRLQHPAFGYFSPRNEYFDSIIRWQSLRNNVTGLEAKHIGYENGVLGGVSSALNAYIKRGDPVLVHTPTYIGFTNTLNKNGFRAVRSPLVRDKNGIWRMDYEDMDRKIKENGIRAVIFCNPYNPCGRVFEKQEIEAANEVYAENDCIVISDEIWSDITLPGHKHIPYQSVNEDARNRCAAFYAPSKTFNLAGLVGSYHIIYNDEMRQRVNEVSAATCYNEMNVLSMYALIGGYSDDGMEWVDELRNVIKENADFAVDYIEEHFDGVSAGRPEGTYMLFIDCGKWLEARGRTLEELEKMCWRVGVAVQDGRMFFGKTHIRMNLALPNSRVREAFDRLDKYVFNFEK